MLRRFDPKPDARPPAEVRFLSLRIEPWPDGRRLKVLIELTPFQEFPNLEVVILDAQSEEVSHTSIIENSEEKLVFTMHLRGNQAEGQEYLVLASLDYPDLPDVDRAETHFVI